MEIHVKALLPKRWGTCRPAVIYTIPMVMLMVGAQVSDKHQASNRQISGTDLGAYALSSKRLLLTPCTPCFMLLRILLTLPLFPRFALSFTFPCFMLVTPYREVELTVATLSNKQKPSDDRWLMTVFCRCSGEGRADGCHSNIEKSSPAMRW